MKISLISTGKGIFDMGIRVISAGLKKEGHDVQLIFLQRDFWEPLKDKELNGIIKLAGKSELIGISLMTNYFDIAVQVTRGLNESLNIPVIWGGVHPSVRPYECLDYADIVCIGEGHETILELAKKMKQKNNFYDIKGLWFKIDGRIKKNEYRIPCNDLDLMPFQDYDFKTHYILNNESIQGMTDECFKLHLSHDGFYYRTLASMTCPFECTYCTNGALRKIIYGSQKITRKRSLSNLVEEIAIIKNRFPFIKGFWLMDRNFFSNYTTEEIREFAEENKTKIKLPIRVVGIIPSPQISEKLSILADAGMVFARMGIQTASEHTRKLYKRPFSNEQVEIMAHTLNNLRQKTKPLNIYYDLIIDNPWETEEDVVDTLMFLSKLPVPFGLHMYSLCFFPGTELYERALQEGIITEGDENIYRKNWSDYKKKYLNSLFFLLNMYARKGERIKPKIMILLTNKLMRWFGFSGFLYFLLYFRIIFLQKTKPFFKKVYGN
jgi:anaerobic magnesium-protoporphyrin IX monomethyl ester cyclase